MQSSHQLKNKNILLICKESFSFPMYFVANELKKYNSVSCFFINPMESYYKKNLMNENTYFKFKELADIKIYDTNEIVERFNRNLNTPDIDWNYLKEIETKYTTFKSINLQLLTSQLFSTNYHNRTYFNTSDYNQQLYWLELNYRKFEWIVNDFNPHVVLDLDNAELPRAVIAEVTNHLKIPYISIDHPRIENYKIPTYSNIWHNNYFGKAYIEIQKKSPNELILEYDYVNNFRNEDKLMSVEYENQITSNYTRESVLSIFKRVVGYVIYCFNQDIISRNIFIKQKNYVLFNSSFLFLNYMIKYEIKRWILFGKNRFFRAFNFNEKYILMPLHLIPESSTSVLAPYYINELFVIEQVSKSLPTGWRLFVKEHQVMAGERNFEFYKKVNALPNAIMVQFNQFLDPKPYIVHSEGVIAITGTAAFESVMLGKSAVVFGDLPFNVIKGVVRARSFEDLTLHLKDFRTVDNIHSCAAYVATVKKVGAEIKLVYLMNQAEQILDGKKSVCEEFQKEIENLVSFYNKAFEDYFKSHLG